MKHKLSNFQKRLDKLNSKFSSNLNVKFIRLFFIFYFLLFFVTLFDLPQNTLGSLRVKIK